ncbi:unnamed protein product [Colias eurytheme]|nr:unnamed protein product [Colias eurytheme]
MNSRYYYLELDVEKLGNAEQPALAAQSLLQHVGRELFGEVGVPHADILRADGSRVLVRVQSQSLRKFRAAIALSPQRIHVCNQAPSLQALI